MASDKIGRDCGESIKVAVCPAVFDRYILTLNIPGLFETLLERRDQMRVAGERPAVQKPDHGQRRLLRPRGERSRDTRISCQCDELAPPHLGRPQGMPCQTSTL